jgi:hypothetical protein
MQADPDAFIRRLIAGSDVADIAVYDVSDRRLYGRKHYRRLTGELAQLAQTAGCLPQIYQSVFWFTLVYLPLIPLGVYLVLPRVTCDDPDGDALQYRALKVPTDRWQIALHYVIGGLLGIIILTVFMLFLVNTLRR